MAVAEFNTVSALEPLIGDGCRSFVVEGNTRGWFGGRGTSETASADCVICVGAKVSRFSRWPLIIEETKALPKSPPIINPTDARPSQRKEFLGGARIPHS
jgi:hypothetical protein